ncbi:unnamed protein product [Rotaria sp. Silwood1]|nr:unnamed protein product [Rotaria sp. Silwood1]
MGVDDMYEYDILYWAKKHIYIHTSNYNYVIDPNGFVYYIAAAACEIKAWQLYNAAEDNLAANPNMPDGQYLKEVNQGRDMMRIASDVRGA